MKQWLICIAIFLSSYVIFLVASAPLSLVVNNSDLPANIKIEGVSGSVWQGKIDRASIHGNAIEEIELSTGFWSLLLFSPTIDVSFGDAMLAGPEGKFTLTTSSSELVLTDVELFLAASDIASELPLPIPVSAQGNVEINLPIIEFVLGENLSCVQGQGDITWLNASVIALEQSVKLGKIMSTLSCTQGNVMVKISPNNNLNLSFDGMMSLPSQKFTGKGHITPGAKFPANLKPALSFLGRPDAKGRYQIKI